MTPKPSGFGISISDVRRDNEGRPKSKIQSRLLSLRRSWSWSLARIAILEVCNLPRRIAAILGNPSLRFGPVISNEPECSQANFYRQSKFVSACIDNMQQLRQKHTFCGPLEVQIAIQAFERGVLWGHRNPCIETHSEQSSGFRVKNESGNSMPPQEVQQDSKCDL